MQLYLFSSEHDPDIFAFAADRTGAALPKDLGPWILTGNGAVPVGAIAGGDAVTDAVAREGYFLGSSKP